jgi:hypothetical protein
LVKSTTQVCPRAWLDRTGICDQTAPSRIKVETQLRENRLMRTSVVIACMGACLMLVGLVAGAAEIEGMPADAPAKVVGERVDAYIQPLVLDGHVSGVLLTARGGEVLYEKAFGMASHELDVPNTPRTVFGVASLTKPMTMMVAAQLEGQGKLALDEPIKRWLPDFPAGDRITVRQLVDPSRRHSPPRHGGIRGDSPARCGGHCHPCRAQTAPVRAGHEGVVPRAIRSLRAFSSSPPDSPTPRCCSSTCLLRPA